MKKILIIEDNTSIRENLEELVDLLNFQAITAINGKEGVSSIQSE